MARTKTVNRGGALVPVRFLEDIKQLIEETRSTVAAAVNASLTMLYWRIGKRIHKEVLREERAGYGKKIVSTLGRELSLVYGRGFSEKNLRHMIRFAEVFPDEKIVSTLWRQLSWSHFKLLIYQDKPLQREFYSEMCRVERWSVRTLQKKIGSMLYERTALSRKPEETVKQDLRLLRDEDRMTPDLVFRDPYVLDFLGLKDSYSEKELEMAILRELESFILELGMGFAFVARQKRMIIDNRDHYLDLLFHHRRLKRLVAVELKLERFKAADKGQMELYLRWLDRYERVEGEEPPLGLILCAEGSRETIELLQLDQAGIHVAEYLTELPPKEVLERKLHATVVFARQRLERLSSGEEGTETKR
jgi:predicted nuclease of restriction endonuclease-like (RecB) superfamily